MVGIIQVGIGLTDLPNPGGRGIVVNVTPTIYCIFRQKLNLEKITSTFSRFFLVSRLSYYISKTSKKEQIFFVKLLLVFYLYFLLFQKIKLP